MPIKTFKEMTIQELMQVDYRNYEQGLVIALAEELLVRMEALVDKISFLNRCVQYTPMVHPDALKATC